MIGWTVLFLTLTVSPPAGAMNRREFLERTTAVGFHSVLPRAPGWLSHVGADEAPALSAVMQSLTKIFWYSLDGVEGKGEVLDDYQKLRAGWQADDPDYFSIYSVTLTNRLMVARSKFETADPQEISKYESFVQVELSRIEKSLAAEFHLPRVRVRAAMAILASPNCLVRPAADLAPLRGDIPLTDAFIDSYLEKLVAFHPDMALWNLHLLHKKVNFRGELGFESVIDMDWDRTTKEFKPRPERALKFEFVNGPFKLDQVSAWPEEAAQAWAHVEKPYLETILRLEQIPAHLGRLPPSRLVTQVLDQVKAKATQLRAEAALFSERYTVTRAYELANAGRVVNLGRRDFYEAIVAEEEVVGEGLTLPPRLPSADKASCDRSLTTSAPEVSGDVEGPKEESNQIKNSTDSRPSDIGL